ncbi:MAG: stage II sporulation protein P [Clostridia bacterium]|nr:stage II sporulation protein P [Clostridia bacterium]
MIVYHGGRKRVVRPGDRDAARVKLVLLALMLLFLSLFVILFASKGLHEGALSLALPSFQMLAGLEPASEETPPAAGAGTQAQTALQVDEVETIFGSVETLSAAETEAPQILIYHTHATEAYLQTAEAPYAESGKWRTKDAGHSVIAVGALLADTLSGEYGRSVLHDTTNHEPPKLSTAYSRSLETMLLYRSRYPSLKVYIDVHRDAYNSSDVDNTVPRDFVTIGGEEVARLMFVVGTGKGATGSGFDEMPDFDSNYAFAESVAAALRENDGFLVRDTRVKTGRYNQHVSDRCLLVEVGHNANTLEQALAAVPYLAAAIDRVLSEETIETASMLNASVWTPDAGGGE